METNYEIRNFRIKDFGIKNFGIKDIIFLAAMLIFGLLLTAGIYLYSGTGGRISITVDGEVYGIYDLQKDQEIPVTISPGKTNLIVIQDGQAYMKEADCPDGLCKHQGAISREKQTIVCLPHRLVVEVIEGEEQQYDAVSQ